MAMFAATARQECHKKQCTDEKCWKDKNHTGFPALSKLKPSAATAATSEEIPQNYGNHCQQGGGESETTASDESEGFTKVAGTFVAAAAPAIAKTELSNRFVPPSTFAEELSEDDS